MLRIVARDSVSRATMPSGLRRAAKATLLRCFTTTAASASARLGRDNRGGRRGLGLAAAKAAGAGAADALAWGIRAKVHEGLL